MTGNEKLYEQAALAIAKLARDRAVSEETSIENLHALADEIDDFVDDLELSIQLRE
jgi:hypothetical protein